MLKIITLFAVFFFLTISTFAQGKTNDEMNRQIRSLGVEKVITVSYDSSGNSSKVMAVAENFSNKDADRAGVMAMNFATGFFYPGTTLTAAPERLHFSFWVKSHKPRFADNHHFTADLGGGKQLDLGEARYSPKPREEMEYLNFELSRTDLAAIAGADNVTFHLGQYTFAVSPAQLKLLRGLVSIVDVSVAK
ncbi:MAG TPA: hypothetical protein VEV84_03020 [Pyrinomonadaceae bacterium]|jgi:hypothetical protein|nr:hypothetical protein [Pyrinomonadaceae bacterium]